MYLHALIAVGFVVGCGSVSEKKAPDCTADAECDDGLFCNGAEVCTAGLCAAATAPSCDDAIACTVDACDEAADLCTQTESADLCGERETCSAETGCVQPITSCRLLSWRYGAPIQLTATAAVADTTVSVVLDTAALVSSGKLRSDCSDLRVHRNLLPVSYWIESGCNTDTTTIWIRATNLVAGANTIDLSYGNLAATTGSSDPTTTFVLFEDFDNGIGAWTLGTDRYDMFDQEFTVTPSTVVAGTGGMSAQLHGRAGCGAPPYDGVMPTVTRAFTNVPPGVCLDFQYRADITTFNYPSSAIVWAIAVFNDDNASPAYSMGSFCEGSGCTATGTWTTASATLPATPLTSLKLGGLVGDCVTGDVYIDDVRLRTCVPPTDLVVTVGTETDCNTL